MEFVGAADRIRRLRRHKELAKIADDLEARIPQAQGEISADPFWVELSRAEMLAVAYSAAPHIERDKKRQAGTRKARGSRMPKLDKWFDAADLSLKNDDLFAALPDGGSDSDLYRDGDTIVEVDRTGSEHDITRAGFDKRATAARKRRK
jgi:hypothetical protein